MLNLLVVLLVLVLTMLVNWYVLVLGHADLQALKAKVPLKRYFNELKSSSFEMMGEGPTLLFGLALSVLLGTIVLVNAVLFAELIVAILLGTWLAKKGHQVPAISNVLNKVATYVNRLRS